MGLDRRIAAALCAASLLVAPGPAGADVPAGVQYQGVLKDGFGAPLNATVTIDLGIWNDAIAGTLIYSETHTSVQVVAGVFTVEIGAGTSGDILDASVFSEQDRWLEVTVDGGTLTPRQKFLSVPYALQAGQVAGLAGNLCPVDSSVTGFDAFGVPICSNVGTKSDVTLDPNGGSRVSIAIGADGFPLVTYYDSGSNFTLIHCTDEFCTGADPAVTLGVVSAFEYSLAIGTDGFPVIAYRDLAGPKLVHCTDASCNTFDTPVVLPAATAGLPGGNPSIGIGGNGFPVIAYQTFQDFQPPQPTVIPFVSVARCLNTACTSVQGGPVALGGGNGISLAIGTAGFPVLTFEGLDLLVAHCTNASCVSFSAETIIEPTITFPVAASIAVSLGTPTILYQVSPDGFTPAPSKITRCADAACLSLFAASVDLPLAPSENAEIAAIGLGSVICSSNEVIWCEDPFCTVITLTTLPKPGTTCSIAIGSDGLPVIALGHASEVSVVHCGDVGCVN